MTKQDIYTVTEETVSFAIGGIITDALTGIPYAVSRDGRRRVALNTPLCGCCDEPVEQCGCFVPTVRISATRIAA